MKTTRKVFVLSFALLLLGSANVSAQGVLGNLAKKGVGALKGTIKSAANAMVGSPEEIEASKRKNDSKSKVVGVEQFRETFF